MKKSLLFLILFGSISLTAQNITGQWNGVLKVQGIQLRLVFHVTKTDSIYSATMDSPDQGAYAIVVATTTFENGNIIFELPNLKIVYNGNLKDGKIEGTFSQAGQTFPMTLNRKAIKKTIVNRPQEPKKPYPYYSENVTFKNSNANISLAGTLTLPEKEGKFPVVILISGSGPQNRDEELLGHKPFLVLSDYLTKNGMAVLRYDDRGVGQSQGDFKNATSADFATDVESAIKFLKTRKEIDKKKIGLVGHSEGGIIAPMVASTSKNVSFIVLLAGTGIRGDKVLLLQQELISKANNVADDKIKKSLHLNSQIYKMIIKSENDQKLVTNLTNLMNKTLDRDSTTKIPNGMTQKDFIAKQISQVTNPWFQYFIKCDPAKTLEKVKCPVLAINGAKDLQVPPKENLSAIKKALSKGKNKNVMIKELPNLNHLFQECETGSPDEYASIDQTFSPTALDIINKWIKKQVGK